MPTIRLTAAEAAELERECLARGGVVNSHVAMIEAPPKEKPAKKKRNRPVRNVAVSLDMPSAVMFVPNWIPTSLNKSIRRHWSEASRQKKAEAALIGAAAKAQDVPPAGGKRRVDLHVILPPGRKKLDDDNAWKSVLDGLVKAKLLIDDRREWKENGDITYSRALDGVHGTMILLYDR